MRAKWQVRKSSKPGGYQWKAVSPTGLVFASTTWRGAFLFALREAIG